MIPATRPFAPAALLCCGLMACGAESPADATSGPVVTASSEPTSAPPEAFQPRLCLPLVSGCGCADRCADGLQQADGSWGVVRPFGDSALDEVTLGRRCFDPRGVSFHEGSAPEGAELCVDVFLADQVCGGECVPRTEFLRCALEDGTCATAP